MNQDPKSTLNQFLQTYTKKPVTKTCVTYVSQKYGEQYQCTVKLNCIDGQEFAGDVSPNQKTAEKLAAQQALEHFKDVIATMPAPGSKKRKASTPAAGVQKVGKVDPWAKPVAIPGVASGASAGEVNPKMQLNSLCMKLVKGHVAKGSMKFEVAETPMGYQCTVQLSCLPGELGQSVWAGEPALTKKDAELNAAKIALESITPEAMATTEAAAAAAGWGAGKGAGKGADMWAWGMDMWGMGKGMGKGKQKKKGPSGDDLPRERISQAPVTGDVVKWMGKYGFVKPHVPIEHAMSKKNQGNLYLSIKDIPGGAPAPGSTLQFQVYSDASGLGAEEAILF